MTVRKPFPIVLAALALVVALPAMTQQNEHFGEREEMSADQQAMMEAVIQTAEPGEAHAELAKSAGTWKARSATWMEPGAEPHKSEGLVERKMLLGGRVLQEHFRGDIMGMPFEGIGLRGYDNSTGEYWGLWMDNTSTAAAPYEGRCSDDYVTCEFTMTALDPATGETRTWRMETEQIGDDTERFTVHETRDGTEFKSRVTVYERTTRSQAARDMKVRPDEN